MALVEWKRIPERERDDLIARLNGAREIGEDGKPRFSGEPFFEDVVGVLESALELPDEIPEVEARRAVSAALFDEGAQYLDAERLRREIENYVAGFLDATPRPYVLVSSVSVEYFDELADTEIAGCRISFHRSLPESFREGYQQAENLARRHVVGELPTAGLSRLRYTFVTVEAEGRSESEAALKAQEALTLQRGIWNLALRRYAPPTGDPHPLNHVLPGPVHSLHHNGGEAVPWHVWYERDYVEPVQSFQSKSLGRHWEEVQEYERIAREGLSSSRYRSAVEGFVRDYALILDGRDPEAAFVRLWGLLERLTGLGERERHDVVTKRASFLVREELRSLQYLVLESLRRHRNTGVHRGVFPSDARDLLRQLRRFVAIALEFHLENRFGFSSVEEVARFLSQPPERDRLSHSDTQKH